MLVRNVVAGFSPRSTLGNKAPSPYIGAYQGRISAAFTLCVADRKQLFVTESVVEVFVSFLEKVGESSDFCAVYCFMPDHLHLAALGYSDTSDLLRAVKIFKQVTGYWLAQHFPLFDGRKVSMIELFGKRNLALMSDMCSITRFE
jgi:hypothetical protein